MEDLDADWSVVTPKKEKKSSPKVQNKKSLKRVELQRSTSSNQVNTRRKLAGTPVAGAPAKLNDNSKPTPPTQKTVFEKKVQNGTTTENDESFAVANDTVRDIIEDVSMSIKRLSIDNLQAAGHAADFRSVALRNNSSTVPGPIQHEAVLNTVTFCDACRTFNPSVRNSAESFAIRGLLNTGCTCFWNCAMQALFSVDVFQRLLLSLLATIDEGRGSLPPSLSSWREVLQLAAEFKVIQEPAVTQQSKVQVVPSYGAATRSSKTAAVAATELMPSLFHTFQDKMDEISGISNHLRDTTIGASDGNGAASQRKLSARKNAQQDAVEFLTFLLDTLHEELVHAEAQNALAPSQYSSSEKLTESDRLTTRSPFPRNATPSMMSIDGEGSTLNSRQNSWDMVIALSRQNSLSAESALATAESAEDGWNTVSKASKAKVKAVVVDAESKKRAASASNASVISRLFHGTLRSEVVYKAKKTNSVTFQQFHCLTLDVANAAGASTSIDSCLNNYFAEELIDDGKVRKQLKLDSLPEVLILQLGRFSYDYYKGIPTKIQKNVEYPTVLSLPARLLSEDLQAQCTNANTPSAQPQQQYQLQTLVLHHGKKATGGHYSAFTREYIPGAPAAGTSAGLVAGPVGANHPSSGSTGAGAGAGAKHSKPPLANKITAPVQAPVVKGDSSDTQHDLRGRSVWRSINDAKISVITEAQALSAQDTVYILFYGRIR